MKYKLIKNKKGALPLIAIAGIIAGIIFLLGFGTTLKIASIINSIPAVVWYGIAFLIILMLLPKRK